MWRIIKVARLSQEYALCARKYVTVTNNEQHAVNEITIKQLAGGNT